MTDTINSLLDSIQCQIDELRNAQKGDHDQQHFFNLGADEGILTQVDELLSEQLCHVDRVRLESTDPDRIRSAS